MVFENLTPTEREIAERLPKPPARVQVQVTNIWIVEWLFDDDRQTGRELHAWANERRSGWAAHISCRSKAEVLAAIAKAAERAAESPLVPVLHLEAHGATNAEGLVGPDGAGGRELLRWDELIDPLQNLNAATRCNLVLVAAACTSISGLKAFTRGPRAPALALVGTCEPIADGRLLEAMKEFYRCLIGGRRSLDEMVDSASRESAPVALVVQPFMELAYESLVEALFFAARPIAARPLHLATEQLLTKGPAVQGDWDFMFMADRDPANADRFGLDVGALLRVLVTALLETH